MKRYWVLSYSQYYPSPDNFDQSFETYEEAEAYVESEKLKTIPAITIELLTSLIDSKAIFFLTTDLL